MWVRLHPLRTVTRLQGGSGIFPGRRRYAVTALSGLASVPSLPKAVAPVAKAGQLVLTQRTLRSHFAFSAY